jgi:hypothetical protein
MASDIGGRGSTISATVDQIDTELMSIPTTSALFGRGLLEVSHVAKTTPQRSAQANGQG